jgi:hypothetical protein
MSALSFDTFAQVERLEKAGLPREQAAAIVQSQKEVLEQALDERTQQLVTKDHFDARMADLRAELVHTKTDLIKWVAGMLVAQAAVVATLVKLL